jgi:DNA-binding transcriptional LysR family regulator
MLDGVSLDQLRTFIAAAEEGNFSAAGRRLRRAQSVVSQTLANLEAQIRVRLFDRSGRVPTLTEQGHALLARARAVATEVDLFKARPKGLSSGLETELSLVVDAMFPVAALASAVASFQVQFPVIPLRLYVEMWEAVAGPVLDGALRHRSHGNLAAGAPAVQLRAAADGQSDQGNFAAAPTGSVSRADSNERPWYPCSARARGSF